jgi:hypothetical protein
MKVQRMGIEGNLGSELGHENLVERILKERERLWRV